MSLAWGPLEGGDFFPEELSGLYSEPCGGPFAPFLCVNRMVTLAGQLCLTSLG